jgi:hypothetical protein
MIGVVRQRALGIAGMTMPRIVIAVRTTARIESGIGAAETTARDPRGSGRDPTPDRRSHFKERVVDHKKRTEVARDKKGGQDLKERRRKFSPQMEKSGK